MFFFFLFISFFYKKRWQVELTTTTTTKPKNIWSHVCGESKTKQNQLIGSESRMVVVRNRSEEWVKCVKDFQRHKLLIVRWIGLGDVIYRILVIVNNTILYIWNSLREEILKVFTTRKKNCNSVRWWMLTKLVVVIVYNTYIYVMSYNVIQC